PPPEANMSDADRHTPLAAHSHSSSPWRAVSRTLHHGERFRPLVPYDSADSVDALFRATIRSSHRLESRPRQPRVGSSETNPAHTAWPMNHRRCAPGPSETPGTAARPNHDTSALS